MSLAPATVPGTSLETSLRTLLRHAVVGAVQVDLEGGFIEANSSWIEMLGYSAAELATLRVADLTHPDDLAETIAAIAQVKAGLSGFVLEKRYIARDGRVVWCLTNVTATRDAEGRASGMFALAVDISERRESERRFAFLADLSQRLAAVSGERAILETTVEAVGRYLGAHRSYFIECFAAEDRIRVSPTWRRDDAPSLEGEYSLFDFGGLEWWSQYAAGDFAIADVEVDPLTRGAAAGRYLAYGVRSYAVQPFKREGARTVVLAATENVARHWTPAERELLENVVARVWPLVEQARAEQALAASRQAQEEQRRFYEAILASSVDYISVIGRDHRFRYVNEPLARYWGRPAREFIGRTLAEIGHSEQQVAQHTHELERVLATGEPVRAEIEAGGTHFEYIMTPLKAADGTVEAVAAVTRDVTADRRRAADKDHFIAMLAHELRNPLAPLRTGLEVARRSPNPARTFDELRPMMDRQVGQLVNLVEDLLDMSRLGLRKMELRRTRVLLANVVAGAVEAARPALDAAGLLLDVDLPAQPVYMEADLTRLTQVLANLLHNSAKFTPAGGRVGIEARRAGADLEITVRDTGIGIAPDRLQNVFNLFAQGERQPQRGAGLGIGLALVKGLVELHGGTVRVESAGTDRGCAFTVRLPALAS